MPNTRITRVQAKIARGEKVRIIIYCRVSTDDQEENGTSLETQKDDCTEYANEKGYIIVDTIMETYSGYELEGRKKLVSVLARCRAKEVDAIVFRNYDRLTRNKRHSTVLRYEAERYGFELLCVKEQYTDDVYGEVMRDLMGSFAEIERMKIRERTYTGKRQRAINGSLINGSNARYGYTYADEKHTCYKIIENEAAIIHRIDALYLDGYSFRAIADILTREKVPTKTNLSIWSGTAISRIIACEEYHGVGYAFLYGGLTREDGKKVTIIKPPEERIKMPAELYPPIRTHETYLALQERRKHAHSTSNKSNTHELKDSLLRGFIFCVHCGGVMTPIIRDKERRLAYRCDNLANNTRLNRHTVQISGPRINNAVSAYIKELLKDVDTIGLALTKYIESHSSQGSVESYSNAIDQIRSQQRDIARDIKSSKGYARDLLMQQLNQLEDEADKLEKYKSEVMGEGQKWESVKKEIQSVIEWMRVSDIDFEHADIKDKRRVLSALGIVVIVSKGIAENTSRNMCTFEIQVRLNGMSSLNTTS